MKIQGMVATILKKQELVLNIGKESGVTKGMCFTTLKHDDNE